MQNIIKIYKSFHISEEWYGSWKGHLCWQEDTERWKNKAIQGSSPRSFLGIWALLVTLLGSMDTEHTTPEHRFSTWGTISLPNWAHVDKQKCPLFHGLVKLKINRLTTKDFFFPSHSKMEIMRSHQDVQKNWQSAKTPALASSEHFNRILKWQRPKTEKTLQICLVNNRIVLLWPRLNPTEDLWRELKLRVVAQRPFPLKEFELMQDDKLTQIAGETLKHILGHCSSSSLITATAKKIMFFSSFFFL